MFTPQPIGFISSPFKNTKEIPKGLGARHEAEGALNILPAFEQGLTDIEGYSHLFVLWAFDRSDGFDLMAMPPIDEHRPHGLTVVELLGREGGTLRVRGVDMLDGSPILDIKPDLSSIPQEKLPRGWI